LRYFNVIYRDIFPIFLLGLFWYITTTLSSFQRTIFLER